MISEPAHGTLSGIAPEIIYTPLDGFIGEDSFGFVVNDGNLDSPHAVIRILVSPGIFLPLVISGE